MNWEIVSKYFSLSEDCIRAFKDKLDWFWIGKCQTLSNSFKSEFAKELKLSITRGPNYV